MKIVIVGNGIAGNEVAIQFRKMNNDSDITIISAESYPEYDPCSLPYFLGGEVSRENIFRKSLADYQQNNIQLVLENQVVSIDPQQKIVITDKENEFNYDKLVLAHGGSLFIPPIDGIDKKGIFSCKQLAQTEKLADHNGSSAVVVGSGAIGIEAAEALKRKGYTVTIVELLDWILPALFDKQTADQLTESLEHYGIQVLTNERVLSIEGQSNVTAVVTDKHKINCDTVVIATGVVPGTALAETAGIETERGIKTNQRMETSIRDIYACGDCIETVDACTGEDAMFQLKHNALDQARVVARNLSGENAVYAGAYAFARAHFSTPTPSPSGKRQWRPSASWVNSKFSNVKTGKITCGLSLKRAWWSVVRPSANMQMIFICSWVPCGARTTLTFSGRTGL